MALSKLTTLLALGASVFCAATSALAIPPPTGNGPVVDVNFPDPTIIFTDGMWYAFATNQASKQINVQIASSQDFTHWTVWDQDALPYLPEWAVGPWRTEVWAPDVNQAADGSYVMYFAALTETQPRKHCIGVATSSNVTGPYTPFNETLVCDLPFGGNIDPNLFQDPVNGDSYLIYKIDGNSIGSGGACGNSNPTPAPTPLRQQPMNVTDLTTKLGPSSFVLDNVPVDGPNIERPSMFGHNGSYYLLYNSGCYTDETYEVRYLACLHPPNFSWCDWTQLEAEATANNTPQVLLKTGVIDGVHLYAPGSVDVSVDGTKMLFHGDINLAWFQGPGHGPRIRAMYAAELVYDNGMLGIGGFY